MYKFSIHIEHDEAQQYILFIANIYTYIYSNIQPILRTAGIHVEFARYIVRMNLELDNTTGGINV